MDELSTRSTSLATAKVSDIVLRTTGTTRLVFRPMLVDNTANPAAAAKGTFVFQRKSTKTPWEDVPAEPLSSLKKEDAYKLALDSGETKTLFDGLAALYSLHAKEGIPRGTASFVRVKGAVAELAALNESELREFLEAHKTIGAPLISRLLAWAADTQQASALLTVFEKMGPEALAQLNSAVGISALREGLALWQANKMNSDEAFWQTQLAKRSFLLEQLFAWPCTVIKERAYVGGKSIHNVGGHIVDFLVENELTTSAALVEIKTPTEGLTGREYRDGIPNITGELAGSIVQLLTYKASLVEHYRGLVSDGDTYRVFDPPCILIIGSSASLTTQEMRRTFELFRHQMGGVQIVTFDELFGRVERLVRLLEGSIG